MDKKEKLEKLRRDIVEVSEAVPNGSNVEVAKKVNLSITYLYQIKSGANAKTPNDDNVALLSKILKAYKSIVKNEINKLEKFN